MADPTPEVIDALVRLMNGETDFDELDDDRLLALGAALQSGPVTLARVVRSLNARGWTFAAIGERLGVHEATVSRWAKRSPSE